MSEQLSWSAEKLQKTEEELAMSRTSLYSAFEEAAMNENAMADAECDDDWVLVLKSLLKISFRLSLNKVVFQLKSEATSGVEIVRDALLVPNRSLTKIKKPAWGVFL